MSPRTHEDELIRAGGNAHFFAKLPCGRLDRGLSRSDRPAGNRIAMSVGVPDHEQRVAVPDGNHGDVGADAKGPLQSVENRIGHPQNKAICTVYGS